MTTYDAPDIFSVPVDGGELSVGRWPGPEGAPVVLGAHGITANRLSFQPLATALAGEATVVVPDLRGRGRSAGVGPPFGIRRHADDLAAILDHIGAESAVTVGHSMGGWVTASLAVRHPERVRGSVFVDGGLGIQVPEGVDVDQVLAAVLGPAMARLSMTFESPDAYLDLWRAHPAVGGDKWSELIEHYALYDLVEGDDGKWRSCVEIDALRADGSEQLLEDDVANALGRVEGPTVLLVAPRGLLDADPLYPKAWLDTSPVPVVEVPDVNHYTIMLTGVAAVADEVRRMLERRVDD